MPIDTYRVLCLCFCHYMCRLFCWLLSCCKVGWHFNVVSTHPSPCSCRSQLLDKSSTSHFCLSYTSSRFLQHSSVKVNAAMYWFQGYYSLSLHWNKPYANSTRPIGWNGLFVAPLHKMSCLQSIKTRDCVWWSRYRIMQKNYLRITQLSCHPRLCWISRPCHHLQVTHKQTCRMHPLYQKVQPLQHLLCYIHQPIHLKHHFHYPIQNQLWWELPLWYLHRHGAVVIPPPLTINFILTILHLVCNVSDTHKSFFHYIHPM